MKKDKELVIIGAGGHGRAVAELIELSNDYNLIGFLDDNLSTSDYVWDYPVLGTLNDIGKFDKQRISFFVAIGNNTYREQIQLSLEESGYTIATVIHPFTYISPRAKIKAGCAIMPGVVISNQAVLEKGVLVNCNAVIDHDARLESFAHLGVGANMAGNTTLRNKAYLTAGSSLTYGKEVLEEKQVSMVINES